MTILEHSLIVGTYVGATIAYLEGSVPATVSVLVGVVAIVFYTIQIYDRFKKPRNCKDKE